LVPEWVVGRALLGVPWRCPGWWQIVVAHGVAIRAFKVSKVLDVVYLRVASDVCPLFMQMMPRFAIEWCLTSNIWASGRRMRDVESPVTWGRAYITTIRYPLVQVAIPHITAVKVHNPVILVKRRMEFGACFTQIAQA
jgi:hypothetical protein